MWIRWDAVRPVTYEESTCLQRSAMCVVCNTSFLPPGDQFFLFLLHARRRARNLSMKTEKEKGKREDKRKSKEMNDAAE
jgi:hypothetical protein